MWFTTFKQSCLGVIYLGDYKTCHTTSMEQHIICMDDKQWTFHNVKYTLELRNILISLCTLRTNGFSYRFASLFINKACLIIKYTREF